MDNLMDKTQAQQFRDRWQAVTVIQQKEALNATIELRWRQLNAAYDISQVLQLSTDHTDEIQVYQRWEKLKRIARPIK